MAFSEVVFVILHEVSTPECKSILITYFKRYIIFNCHNKMFVKGIIIYNDVEFVI